MPLYEYKCKQCKKHTEHIQKFSDPEITKCPLCGGSLERVISAAAISFKGGGWFKDGYSHARPKSSRNDATASSSSSSNASSNSSSTTTPAASSPAATPSSTVSASK